MKSSLSKVIIFLLIISFSLQDMSIIKRIVDEIFKQIPELKKELDNTPVMKETIINKIVGRGFTTFKQTADMSQYTGVPDENVIPFLNYIKGLIKLPPQFEKNFVDTLSMVLYADFNHIIITKVLYSVDSGGDCKYVCVMGQRNEKTGMSDWLIGDVKAEFTLAPDVLFIKKKESNIFGLIIKEETTVVTREKVLTEQQMDYLFKFFEVIVFERFEELLQISPVMLKFLQ